MQIPTYTYTDPFDQTIEFSIPFPHTNICISISGGADSAILLYMLINYCEEYRPDAEIHIITASNPLKGWKNAKWSTNVIDTILHLTKTNLIKSHHTVYSEEDPRQELTSTEKMIQIKHGVTFIIDGTTQNPAVEISNTFGPPTLKKRNPGHGRDIWWTSDTGVKYFVPFMHVDKRMVAHLYKHFDMLDALFLFTRSCEWHNSNTFDSPNPGDGHCGKCWWCKEREWAFGRL